MIVYISSLDRNHVSEGEIVVLLAPGASRLLAGTHGGGAGGSYTFTVKSGSTYSFAVEWGDHSGFLGLGWSYSGWTSMQVTAW